MKFIESIAIDKDAWLRLTQQNSVHLFSEITYLDAVAENWGAYVKGNYEAAIVIPYRMKFSMKWVYIPLFYRASEWIGTWSDEEKNQVLAKLQKEFNAGELSIEDENDEQYFYQSISSNAEFQSDYNKLAHRMLKKAMNSPLTLTNEFHEEAFMRLIVSELSQKVTVWNEVGKSVFMKLIRNYQDGDRMKFYGTILHGDLVGGIVVLESDSRNLYLKGTATVEAKKMGAMYLLMDTAIQDALKKKCTFDFGGSRVDGVARFNQNLGGINVHYRVIKWDNFPYWFIVLKRIKNKWK